jgi:GNAT superfamily N-acetyltransferase
MGDWTIREARDDDAWAMARLIREANPNMVVTPASWVHGRRIQPARARALHLVAEVDGAVIARAHAGLDPHTTTDAAGFGSVIVDPQQRRRGIGTCLAARLEQHLAELAAETWTSIMFENAAGVAFAERNGFAVERTAVASAVDPRSVSLDVPGADEAVPVGVLGPEAVYGIDIAGMLDEPAANPADPPPFGEWLDDPWNEPSFTREGSFVVSADGTPAALALLYVAPEVGRGLNAFTATLPEFRGRGLALAAKVASLRWAAANAITQVSTANDDTNAPMLAINARLGYAPIGRLLTMRRTLSMRGRES